MSEEVKKEAAWYILIIAISLLISALAYDSFFNLHVGVDSSVFQYVATEMQHGNIPYVDTFDHKGPLLYLINYIALLIPGENGLFLIEFIFGVLTHIIMFKIAHLSFSPLISITSMLLCDSFLLITSEGGNLAEEYALLFISTGIYIFLKYFISNETQLKYVVLSGFSFGAVLLLRPNMVAIWISGCLLVFINCVLRKEAKKVFGFILAFIIGIIVIIAPFIVWLHYNGALNAAFDSYILFNLKYSSSGIVLADIISAIYTLLLGLIPITSLIGILILTLKNLNICSIFILASWIISAFLIVMPGNLYFHYAMTIIPIMFYPIAQFIFDLNNLIYKISKNKLLYYMLLLIVLGNLAHYSETRIKTIQSNILIEKKYKEISSLIKEKTDKDDLITVYGNMDYYYLLSDRMSASRYSYQFPIGEIDKEIMDNYFQELVENKPKIIVWEKTDESDRMYSFLTSNKYICEESKIIYYLDNLS